MCQTLRIYGFLIWLCGVYRDLKITHKLFLFSTRFVTHRARKENAHFIVPSVDKIFFVQSVLGTEDTLKENAEALVAATREIGLEVSADKTKYMVMSRDQNAGRNHSVRINNSTLERVEEYKYLGTNLTKPKFYSGRN